ncbi:hypothetical protein HDU84_003998 [Entophlyctis sp. JEL0112]|nr:hypothetical protein HDU84_003998 [Entophlyctis sp. JEL0112]
MIAGTSVAIIAPPTFCKDAAPPPMLIALAAVACDRLTSEFAAHPEDPLNYDSGTGSDVDDEFDVAALLRKPNLLTAAVAPLSPLLVTCFTPAAMYPPLLDSPPPLAPYDAATAVPPAPPSIATRARLRTRSLSFHPYHITPTTSIVGSGWRARSASVSVEGATRCCADDLKSAHVATNSTAAVPDALASADDISPVNISAPPQSPRLRPRTTRQVKENFRPHYQLVRQSSTCNESAREDDTSVCSDSDGSDIDTPDSDDDDFFSPGAQVRRHTSHPTTTANGVSSGRIASANIRSNNSNSSNNAATRSAHASASGSASHHRPVVKQRANFPHSVLSVLTGWLEENKGNPYPTVAEKTKLGRACGLNMKQVNNWFINARRRRI